jgi:hypothetical protein
MATDPLRRLEERLRQVDDPHDLPPDLLCALEVLAAAFGTSLEGMRDRIITQSSSGDAVMTFIRALPRDHNIKPKTRLAALVANGRATLPRKTKRPRTKDDLIPIRGPVSELVIEDRRH